MNRFLPFFIFLASCVSASADLIPAENFDVPDDLEVSVWASSTMFYNPTNMDVDQHGRIWVAEAVNYRKFKNKEFDVEDPESERVVWLQDADGDGKADKSQVFVQDKDLVAPLGISVIDNRILVAAAPHMVQYTDVDRNGVFDPKIGSVERCRWEAAPHREGGYQIADAAEDLDHAGGECLGVECPATRGSCRVSDGQKVMQMVRRVD